MIYLVEDDDNIRKLVSYALTKEGYTIKSFVSPKLFWMELSVSMPELILLDIMLPEEDGLSILKKLRSQSETKDVPVMMLTAKDSEYDKVMGLDMGADDYITKPFSIMELLSRVKAVLRRYEKTKKNDCYLIDTLYVNFSKHIVEVSRKPIILSHKEYSILEVLLKANGNVVRREELFAKVWGEFYGESRTLDVHIRKLRMKLETAGHLIQTVKNVGYQIRGKEHE